LAEENECKVKDYLTVQYELNDKMRGILIDWLIEVHHKFGLKEETLFLTVGVMDHYLSKALIARSKLQLLGIACLLIACKYEEILVPCVADLVFVTDNAYSSQDVFKMEEDVLKQLEFNIVIPSSLRIFELIAQGFAFTSKQLNFGKYLLFLSLLNYSLNKYSPSVIACGVGYIVMKYFRLMNYTRIYDEWNLNSDYATLKECARDMCVMVDSLDKFYTRATIKRFSSERYDRVSLINFS
jgi:hypothetical protein